MNIIEELQKVLRWRLPQQLMGDSPSSDPPAGGSGTTYTIPAGLTLRQKKALAALLACAPCCGGSGSGSGPVFIPCIAMETDLGFGEWAIDYEVTVCFPGSDTGVPWTGAACSGTELFSTGTGAIFVSGDTEFGDGGNAGPIVLLWCDGEATYWIGDPFTFPNGLIQFAFTCYEVDGSTMLAFYAMLTLDCGGGDVTSWGYKTRDIAYEPGLLTGDPTVYSVTGLSPFTSQVLGAGCECDPPVLSLAFIIDPP